jgi:hypothetical protein
MDQWLQVEQDKIPATQRRQARQLYERAMTAGRCAYTSHKGVLQLFRGRGKVGFDWVSDSAREYQRKFMDAPPDHPLHRNGLYSTSQSEAIVHFEQGLMCSGFEFK